MESPTLSPTPDAADRPVERERAGLSHRAASAILDTGACIALLFGLLIYLTDRPSSHSMLVPAALSLGTGALFAAIGQWLPSFIHPFAFSLLTAAHVSSATRPAYGACAAWWAVNVAFELGQHPGIAPLVIDRLPTGFGAGWLTQPVSTFLRRGTFDPGDLIAATSGVLAAALVLWAVHRREVCDVPR